MHAPQSIPADLPDVAAAILARLAARSPRVHCITNAVAQNFTANVLLAVGAVPSMTVAPEEIAEFVARADALLVNLGTLDRERREAAAIAVEAAAGRPWLLDPVFVDRSASRTAFARALAAKGPRVVRLNGAEFSVLADAAPTDDALKRYALDRRCVVALTGATAAGLLAFAVAGECAVARARGPGSFAVEIVDALAALDLATLRARARVG